MAKVSSITFDNKATPPNRVKFGFCTHDTRAFIFGGFGTKGRTSDLWVVNSYPTPFSQISAIIYVFIHSCAI